MDERSELDEAREALQLVLMFYRVGPWRDEDITLWEHITGGRDASTKSMCDHIRKVLAGDDVGIGGRGEGERSESLAGDDG